MSKLAIVLCAVLFASAANAFQWSVALRNTKHKVKPAINAAIDTVQEQYEDTLEKVREASEKLSNATRKFYEEKEKVQIAIKRADDEIKKLIGNVNDSTLVTDCLQFSHDLARAASGAIQDAETCTIQKRDDENTDIRRIVNVLNNTLANLTKIMDEAQHCGDNAHNLESTQAAILCAAKAGIAAISVSTNVDRDLIAWNTKLNLVLDNFPRFLNNCTRDSGLITVRENWKTHVDRTEECIKEKSKEANTRP